MMTFWAGATAGLAVGLVWGCVGTTLLYLWLLSKKGGVS